MDRITELLALAWGSPIIKLVILAVVMDTCFGCIRAIKEHEFNSCFGIDGAIRKISMVASLAFLLILDRIVHLNLIGFIPEVIRSYLPVSAIGVAEFFGLLYIAYELVSILKNMTLCGLPVKRLWETVKKFLTQYTEELPDNT
ncbi:phage holin family protein [Clostridium boliviensis]|uniref:Phage holin family protein n=1 Tax=Clostridium boliviensis TaxID=318465 RepID=A0ABU4GQJ5_9CLOT|nr:phage holin family protein [Clostridium boliviensis]MDW2799908.1 phage holin family protein [Clostridium boliviensis]